MSNEILVIEKVEIVPFFTAGTGIDATLEAIAKEVRSHVPDVSTAKGRDAIKATVTKVVKSKTFLESKGKELAAEYKEIPKRIDANRKKAKDFLTELQNEIRQPLTDWEDEQARIAEQKRLDEEAEKLKSQIEVDHEIAILLNEKFDRDLAEQLAQEAKLESERLAKLEAERIERENQIRIEAAAKAEQEKLEAIERAKQAELYRVEAEKRAKFEAEQAEIRRIEEAKQAELMRTEAARQAEINAQLAAEKARADEIAKHEAIKAAEEAEQKRKEANVKHVSMIRTQAKESIMAIGFAEEDAKKLVLALSNGLIANCVINY
jgi:colicin import membrane protein